jgi:hypothetical protein
MQSAIGNYVSFDTPGQFAGSDPMADAHELTTRVTVLEATGVNISSDVGTLKQDVGTLKQDVAALKQTVGKIPVQLATLSQKVSSHIIYFWMTAGVIFGILAIFLYLLFYTATGIKDAGLRSEKTQAEQLGEVRKDFKKQYDKLSAEISLVEDAVPQGNLTFVRLAQNPVANAAAIEGKLTSALAPAARHTARCRNTTSRCCH